ncbi:MAG: PEP-CTERM sorting domain-containing protein [Planctomycetota bacterium]
MKHALIMIGLVGAAAMPASATINNGFFEDFDSGTGGFGFNPGQSSVEITNPGTGGVGGAGDGFLSVETTSNDQLAARAVNAQQYQGDYLAAGVTSISFWLRDLGQQDAAIIRVGLGARQGNFWVSNRSWDATDDWQRFGVELTDASQWTQIIGSGSFEDALRNADALQFRHAVLPDGRRPDSLAGSFGVDRIALVPAPSAVAGLLLAGGVMGGRRR